MTRREFYKKLHPVVVWRMDEYKRHGALAVADAFYICCLKEMDFRLDYEADDQADDIPEFDEMTPGFFLNEFSQIVEDWDEAAELLLPGDGEGQRVSVSSLKCRIFHQPVVGRVQGDMADGFAVGFSH